eukprot:648323-Alexandrium_andersonii.AAC.1
MEGGGGDGDVARPFRGEFAATLRVHELTIHRQMMCVAGSNVITTLQMKVLETKGCAVASFRTRWTPQSAPLLLHTLRNSGRSCIWAVFHSRA